MDDAEENRNQYDIHRMAPFCPDFRGFSRLGMWFFLQALQMHPVSGMANMIGSTSPTSFGVPSDQIFPVQPPTLERSPATHKTVSNSSEGQSIPRNGDKGQKKRLMTVIENAGNIDHKTLPKVASQGEPPAKVMNGKQLRLAQRNKAVPSQNKKWIDTYKLNEDSLLDALNKAPGKLKMNFRELKGINKKFEDIPQNGTPDFVEKSCNKVFEEQSNCLDDIEGALNRADESDSNQGFVSCLDKIKGEVKNGKSARNKIRTSRTDETVRPAAIPKEELAIPREERAISKEEMEELVQTYMLSPEFFNKAGDILHNLNPIEDSPEWFLIFLIRHNLSSLENTNQLFQEISESDCNRRGETNKLSQEVGEPYFSSSKVHEECENIHAARMDILNRIFDIAKGAEGVAQTNPLISDLFREEMDRGEKKRKEMGMPNSAAINQPANPDDSVSENSQNGSSVLEAVSDEYTGKEDTIPASVPENTVKATNLNSGKNKDECHVLNGSEAPLKVDVAINKPASPDNSQSVPIRPGMCASDFVEACEKNRKHLFNLQQAAPTDLLKKGYQVLLDINGLFEDTGANNTPACHEKFLEYYRMQKETLKGMASTALPGEKLKIDDLLTATELGEKNVRLAMSKLSVTPKPKDAPTGSRTAPAVVNGSGTPLVKTSPTHKPQAVSAAVNAPTTPVSLPSSGTPPVKRAKPVTPPTVPSKPALMSVVNEETDSPIASTSNSTFSGFMSVVNEETDPLIASTSNRTFAGFDTSDAPQNGDLIMKNALNGIAQLKDQESDDELKKTYDEIVSCGQEIAAVLGENPADHKQMQKQKLAELHKKMGEHIQDIENKVAPESKGKVQEKLDELKQQNRKLLEALDGQDQGEEADSPLSPPVGTPATPGAPSGNPMVPMDAQLQSMHDMMTMQKRMQVENQQMQLFQQRLEMQKNQFAMMLENMMSLMKILMKINQEGNKAAEQAFG